MTTIEIFKQEIENELDQIKQTLEELKLRIRNLSDVERVDSVQDIEELEKVASDMRVKIMKLNDDMEDSLDQIKNDVNSSRNIIKEAFARLNRALV